IGARTLPELRVLPAEKPLGIEEFRTGVNIDGYVLPEDVGSEFAQGKQNNVRVLVGSNANEMTTLSDVATFPTSLEEYRRQIAVRFPGFSKQCGAAYPVKSEADIPGALLTVGRDQAFTAEMRTWARLVTAAGQKAFLYQFTHVPPSPNAKAWGAYHAAEIPYVFGTLRNRDWPYTQTDFKLSNEMSSYWSNFAMAGDPNGRGLPAWNPYDQAQEPYLELGDKVQIKEHLQKAQLDFLDDAALRRRTVSR